MRALRDRIRLSAALAVTTLALGACKVSIGPDDTKVSVDCEGNATEPFIDCAVKHTSGDKGADVCWDLEFKCLNGTVVTGSNLCQGVDPGATAQRRVPLGELQNSAQCDKVSSSEVRNLKITPR